MPLYGRFEGVMLMKAIHTLAVDLGASNGRGIIGSFDGEKLTLSEVHRFKNAMILVNESSFWDILHLFNKTKTCIQKAWRETGGKLSSAGIDGWAQDFGLLDSQGNLLGNVHTYRDPRWIGLEKELLCLMTREEYYDITGLLPGSSLSLFQLVGMKKRERACYEAADTFLFVPDLINYLLTGEKVCNITTAGLSGLYDIGRREWSRKVLNTAGLREIFPSFVGTHDIIGEIGKNAAEQMNIGKLHIVSVAAHDTMSALAFAPGRKNDALLLSSGTWSLYGHAIPEPISSPGVMRQKLFNEVGFDHEMFLIRNITGFWIVEELFSEWGEAPDYERLNAAAMESVYRGYIDVDAPEFAAPGRMEEKITGFLKKTGQKVPGRKEDFYLCVLLSLAMKYRQLKDAMELLGDRSFDCISIVGGGSKNTVLNTLTADICGKMVIAGPSEATAIGNILCQLISLGEIRVEEATDLAARSFETSEILSFHTDQWQEQYGQYLHIVSI